MFDEYRAGISVISHAIAADPGIAKGQRQKKNEDEGLFEFIGSAQALRFPAAWGAGRGDAGKYLVGRRTGPFPEYGDQ